MSALASDELHRIYESRISVDRRDSFLERFLADREKTRTVEMLFERANALQHMDLRPAPEEVMWTGFSALVFKGPFVDLPNWAPLETWSFAVAMERHLLERLEKGLRDTTERRLGTPTNRDASSVITTFESLSGDLSQRGYTPSLYVLAGPLGTQLAVDLKDAIVGAWNPEVKDTFKTTFRIMGTYRGIPILDIPESESPGVYAVDLAKFGRLARYGDLPHFKIDEITAERASNLIAKDPKLGSLSPGETGVDGDPVRTLQLKVELQLFETYDLTIVDGGAAAGTSLTGPVLEWQAYRNG